MMDPNMLSFLNVTEADIVKDLPSKNRAVVLDIGSSQIKAGFAGDSKPSCVVPTSAAISGGCVEEYSLPCLMDTDDNMLPIQNGISTSVPHAIDFNEHSLEAILNYTLYSQLGIRSNEYSILITQSFLNHRRNKEKIAQLLFEKFLCPSCFLISSSELSMYSSGRITGVCMDIGASDSHCVPMRDGYAMSGFITHCDVTGNVLTERLNQLLKAMGHTNLDRQTLEDIKKRKCQVAPNLFSALAETEDEIYCLPNGQDILIGKERFQCPEMLFNPVTSFNASASISQAIFEAIENIENAFGKGLADKMYKNIVLAGGTANLANLGDRLTAEINQSKKRDADVKVTVLEEGSISAFRGGSVLSSLPTYTPLLITRDDYMEHGMNAIYRKL